MEQGKAEQRDTGRARTQRADSAARSVLAKSPFITRPLGTTLKELGLGPKAAKVLQAHTSIDLGKLYFGKSLFGDVDGVRVHISRGGYTGEDGFEVRPMQFSCHFL
jgi:glycine cleavage system aminomethyltransferase T